jgi:hypothetical protein
MPGFFFFRQFSAGRIGGGLGGPFIDRRGGKGRSGVARRLSMLLLQLPAGGPPAFTVLPNPVQQGALKPDVVAKALGLNPLVLQDFLPFG